MKTILAVILAATLTGCGTAQQTQIDQLNKQLAEMQKNDAAQRKHIATLVAAKNAPQQPPAPAPAASVPATVPSVGTASSLVYQEPNAYQCFVGEGNPGFGGGHWVKIQNLNRKYDLSLMVNGRWDRGGTKVIVMVPRPGSPRRRDLASWVPYIIGRSGLTALPAMTSCHLWVMDRLNDDESLKSFKLFSDAYQPSVIPYGDKAMKRWSKASVLKTPVEFNLYGQTETTVSLEWFQFI